MSHEEEPSRVGDLEEKEEAFYMGKAKTTSLDNITLERKPGHI